MYKSIRNGCLNQLRHENVRKKYFESLPDDWESEDYFMENVIKEEVANIVLQEINKLSETSRKFYLRHWMVIQRRDCRGIRGIC